MGHADGLYNENIWWHHVFSSHTRSTKWVQFRSVVLSMILLILERFYFRSMVFYPKLPRASAFVWFSHFPPSTNFLKLSDLKSTKIKESFINFSSFKNLSASKFLLNLFFSQKFCLLTSVMIFQLRLNFLVGIEWFVLGCCSYIFWWLKKLIKNLFDRILVLESLKLFPLKFPNHSGLQTLVHFS